jgi:TorA maturation chaperone TorD
MSKPLNPHQMCFGLSTELDRESVACFLQLLGRKELAETLAERLSSSEVEELVQFTTGLMKKNMTEDEYHELFLQEESPHKHP